MDKDYQAYYESGLAFAKKQKWQKAIAQYRSAIECNGKAAEVYHHWGDACIELQQWQKAVSKYERAVALGSDSPWSYHNLGVALEALDKLPEAVTQYKTAVELNDKNPQFHLSLGKAEASLGSWEDAAASYQSAIALGTKNPIHHELGDIFSQLQRWNDAISAYQAAIAMDASSIWSYHNLGKALLQLQLYQEAIPFFRQAVKLDRNFVSAHYYLAVSWRSLYRWERAVPALRKVVKLDPEFADATLLLADTLTLRSQTDLDAAIATYQQLIETANGNSAELNLKIAEIFEQKQQFDLALVYVQQAVELEPTSTQYSAVYKSICQTRSKLYEPLPVRKIADRSYSLWSQQHQPTSEDLRAFCWQLTELTPRPTVAIILPLKKYAPWVEEAIAAIQNQVYPHWQLYLATATVSQEASAYWQDNELARLSETYAKNDPRIHHISGEAELEEAALANLALEPVKADWIAVVAPQTFLTPDALFEFVRYLENLEADIVYGDEDRIIKNDLLSKPWFKPQWCPDLLRSRNYWGSLVFCRTEIVKQQGFMSGYGAAYRYDLFLRLSEQTSKIARISKIFCHSKHKATAELETTKAVNAAIERSGVTATVSSNPEFPEIKTIHYHIERQNLVSIIIPTRNMGEMLHQALTSVFELTTYSNYEVLIVDNGSNDPETRELLRLWQEKEPERLNILSLDIPFNYSLLNNQAVAATKGKYLLFLNNDTEVITPDWIEGMVQQAQRATIGAVGALLLYPDETIQHAGVILGVTGVAGHGHRNYPSSDAGYKQALATTANYSAVTAACMMCRREVFEEVGGFNEDLAIAYNDVDFCLKLQQQGYNNIWLPHVRLYHYESQSRTPEDTPEKLQRIGNEIAYMKQTWGTIIKDDPCYSLNLTRESENYGLNLQHQAEIRAVFLAEVSPQLLQGFFFDEPKAGATLQEHLEIVGWALGNSVPVSAIEIKEGDATIAATKVDRERPDVAEAYPQSPLAQECGFATDIPTKLLPQAQLSIEAILQDGNRVKLGTIHFK